MYDAVFLYARAVERALIHGYSIDNGAALVKLMADMSWTGSEMALGEIFLFLLKGFLFGFDL